MINVKVEQTANNLQSKSEKAVIAQKFNSNAEEVVMQTVEETDEESKHAKLHAEESQDEPLT